MTNEEEALKWFRVAADGGFSYAQCRLAQTYEDGDLSWAIDLQVASMWFKKAVEGGNYFAQFRLA